MVSIQPGHPDSSPEPSAPRPLAPGVLFLRLGIGVQFWLCCSFAVSPRAGSLTSPLARRGLSPGPGSAQRSEPRSSAFLRGVLTAVGTVDGEKAPSVLEGCLVALGLFLWNSGVCQCRGPMGVCLFPAHLGSRSVYP